MRIYILLLLASISFASDGKEESLKKLFETLKSDIERDNSELIKSIMPTPNADIGLRRGEERIISCWGGDRLKYTVENAVLAKFSERPDLNFTMTRTNGSKLEYVEQPEYWIYYELKFRNFESREKTNVVLPMIYKDGRWLVVARVWK